MYLVNTLVEDKRLTWLNKRLYEFIVKTQRVNYSKTLINCEGNFYWRKSGT